MAFSAGLFSVLSGIRIPWGVGGTNTVETSADKMRKKAAEAAVLGRRRSAGRSPRGGATGVMIFPAIIISIFSKEAQ